MSDLTRKEAPFEARVAHTLVVFGLVLAIALVLSALSDIADPNALLPLAGRAVSLLHMLA